MFRLVSRILDNKKNHPPLNLATRTQKEISSVRPLQTPLHILKVYSTKVSSQPPIFFSGETCYVSSIDTYRHIWTVQLMFDLYRPLKQDRIV